MGRLIDADAFAITLKQISEKHGYAELYMNVDDVLNSVIDDLQGNALNGYENCPTVEAIPKEQYETRLKADMVAMLTDIQMEIEEHEESIIGHYGKETKESDFPSHKIERNNGRKECINLIQQKINALKAESEDQDGQTND